MRCENGVQSDPNRSSNVTTYAAGQTITVEFDEYIGHTGRIRVAFDPDGADLADFNAHVLADIPDPSGDGGRKTIQVTLPDTPCARCTLQLIQVMNGNTRDPIANPTGASTYYDCADIVLTGISAGEGEGEAEGDEGEAPVGEGEGEPEAPVGEGEGEGEPAPPIGEGEGDVGEGEGEGAVGEGEGEGAPAPLADGGSCASAGLAAPIALLAIARRRRR